MKRYPVLYFLLAIIISSCHFKHKGEADEVMDASRSASELIGAYDEPSVDSEVKLYVLSVSKESINGDFGTQDRNWDFSVPLVKTDTANIAELHDSTYKKIPWGILRIAFDINDTNKATVTWTPSSADTVSAAKAYALQRKLFTYANDKGNFPEASVRLLLDSDVNKASKERLQFIRNEIYARHGYCFEDEYWQGEFEFTDWYVPHSADVSKELTDIEKKNIVLIKKYEKTAKDDDFGRE